MLRSRVSVTSLMVLRSPLVSVKSSPRFGSWHRHAASARTDSNSFVVLVVDFTERVRLCRAQDVQGSCHAHVRDMTEIWGSSQLRV